MTTPRRAFADQAEHCARLGSPFMARLMTLFADRLAPGTTLAQRILNWQGDPGARADSVPLRLAGALHALRLAGDAPLADAYPPHEVPDNALWQAVAGAMAREAGFIDRFIDSPPQTNEVRRAAALVAVAGWLAARHDLPLVLSELGASGGLNLNFDRFAVATPQGRIGADNPALTLSPTWQGAPPAPHAFSVAARRGVDLNPLDGATPEGRQRLLAYLWPDQPDRLALTGAALDLPQASVDRSDAIAWLENRLAKPMTGQLHLIYHTIAWQYFPAEAQARGRALIEAAGAKATPDAPLAWFGMETDGGDPGAALHLRLWPGDLRIDCGRFDFHGRWIDWRAP